MTSEAQEPAKRVRPVIAALAIFALISAIFTVLLATGRVGIGTEPETAPGLRGEALPEGLDRKAAPPISLRDASGREFTTSTLDGEPYLVTFVYTECPDVCPLIGQDIRQALEDLDPDDVTAVAVSVDPTGDTPEAARRWIDEQDLPANFHYLLGDEEELRPTWEDWFTVPSGETEIDPKMHASSVWVVDAEGRLRSRYSEGAGIDPDDLAFDLRTLSRQGPSS